VSISGGPGSNTVSTNPGFPGSLNVGGNLSIVTWLAPCNESIAQLEMFRGNVQIQNLSGNAMVSIAVASADDAIPPANTIHGNVLIVNGRDSMTPPISLPST